MVSLKQMVFAQIHSTSLAEQVYENLFSEIVTVNIPGGTKLIAASLAKEIGVSITPVREALQRLTVEGFMSPIPRVGYIVEDMSDKDVLDLFEARAGMERFAAKLAIKQITDAEIGYL